MMVSNIARPHRPHLSGIQVSQARSIHHRPATQKRLFALRPNETPEQALERRLRESNRVEERVTFIHTEEEWEAAVAEAGDRLVVVEVNSEQICETGFDEEPELHWKLDKEAALLPCRQLKHTFVRTARDCPDVVFLAADVDAEECSGLCTRLGIEVLPTLQFWRSGQLLFEHRGVVSLEQDLGEGVLYFGDTAANNEKASTYVKDLHSRSDLEAFVSGLGEKELGVVDISLTNAAPCVHIFPAVLALARNFTGGYASFARLMGDENEELKGLMTEYNIVEVPTFLFFRSGEYVGRHVGSSRGDLIGQILQQQANAGISAPTPESPRQRRIAKKRSAKPRAKAAGNRW